MKTHLRQEDIRNPMEFFQELLEKAKKSEPSNANAMSLATVGRDGMPSVRVMLLKQIDEDGFVFYTNLHSHKGRDIKENNKVALGFYWKSMDMQVRITGQAIQVDDEEADEYFKTRPRNSQLGAWSSRQSHPMESRDSLDEWFDKFEKKYEGKDVPRPSHWSGFRIYPETMEFWESVDFRLHNRIFYDMNGRKGWTAKTLYP